MSRLLGVLVAAVVALALLAPMALADPAPVPASTTSTTNAPVAASRVSTNDPLNGGFLLLNMHGMLFHPATSDIVEDLSYARWLGGGIIRVFATDSSGIRKWDGTRV